MARNTGFTAKVRELLKNEGPKMPKEIKSKYENLVHGISNNLRYARDIHYLGSPRLGVYYLHGQEEQAKKRSEELRLESERRLENHKREYMKKLELELPSNPDIRTSLDVFRSDKDEYTIKEIWGMMGGKYIRVASGLKSLAQAGVLLVVDGMPKKYKRNPKYAMICDGAYEEAQKEIFRK
jgi:hypothetical protein